MRGKEEFAVPSNLRFPGLDQGHVAAEGALSSIPLGNEVQIPLQNGGYANRNVKGAIRNPERGHRRGCGGFSIGRGSFWRDLDVSRATEVLHHRRDVAKSIAVGEPDRYRLHDLPV